MAPRKTRSWTRRGMVVVGGGGGEEKLELQRKLPKRGWGVRRALEEA